MKLDALLYEFVFLILLLLLYYRIITKLYYIAQETVQQLKAERDILASKAELEEDRRNVEATMARNENQVGNIEERVAQLEQYGQHATRGGLSGTILHTL